MTPQSTNSTAIQRLGHVLGWTGFALGIPLVLAGVVMICITAWSYFNPGDVSSGYRMELPDGGVYIALGEGTPEDAELAVREFAGQEIAIRPYNDWKVYPEAAEDGELSEEIALESEKVRAVKRARIRKTSLDGIAGWAIFCVAPGVLIVLIGMALRYIFSGPKTRPT